MDRIQKMRQRQQAVNSGTPEPPLPTPQQPAKPPEVKVNEKPQKEANPPQNQRQWNNDGRLPHGSTMKFGPFDKPSLMWDGVLTIPDGQTFKGRHTSVEKLMRKLAEQFRRWKAEKDGAA